MDARRASQRARRAERLGRSTRPEIKHVERLVARRGSDGLAALLISRANRRWESLIAQAPLAGSLVIPRLSQLVSIDAALLGLGLTYRVDGTMAASPAIYRGDWLQHLRWGADTIAGAGRLLLLGQAVGAVALTRQGFERWTANRASALGLEPATGESRSAFFDRVWRDGTFLRLDLRRVYDGFSELLHGRGPFLPLIYWEAEDLTEGLPSGEALAAVAVLADLGTLVLQQVTACVLDVCLRTDRTELGESLLEWPRTVDPPPEPAYGPLRYALLPLSPAVLVQDEIIRLGVNAEIYERDLPRVFTEDHLPGPSLATLALLHRRHRAAQAAIAALEEEQAMVGEEFRLDRLVARETRYILIAELAALAGRWSGGPVRDGLLVAASALRSAFLLWLEDDDRSMIPARTILEQVARARTWRTKPERAARIEARGSRTSPRDWLEAAGWRRFGVLNTALGELSHASLGSRWDGALDALAAVQPDAKSYVGPEHTARGSALDQVSYLLATETLAHVALRSRSLVEPARHLLGIGREPERVIEGWQATAWRQRAFDFGDPVFTVPSDEEMRRFGYTQADGPVEP